MRIAASEWRIMEAAWGLETVGAAEVIAAVQPQTGWNHRTIRTLLNRLVEKGLLSLSKADGRNLYQPRVERSECVRQEAQSFLERVFHGRARDWRQARACAEFACDEAVLAGNETPARAAYGRALLRAAELPWAAKPPPGAVGALSDRAGLVARLDRVLAPPRHSRAWAVTSGVLLLVLAAATLTDAAPAKAESAAAAKARTDVTPPPTSAARTLRWRVTGPDGRPAAGAALHVSIWSPDAPRKGSQDYVCDAAGEAVLQLPGRVDILRVWSSAAGCVPLFTHWERERPADSRIPTEFTVQLPPGTVIGGKVVDEEGRPIAGASVEVSLPFSPSSERQRTSPNMWLATEEDACRTDRDGRWELNTVPADYDVLLRLSHPEFLSDSEFQEPTGAQDEGGAMDRLRARTSVIVLRRGIVLTGTVSTPDGDPVPSAVVIRGDNPYLENGSQEVLADERGRYRFPPVAPGPLNVTVVAQGWAPELKQATVAADVAPLDFRLQRGKTLRLQFTDTEGRPVPSAYAMLDLNTTSWRGLRSLYNIKHPNVLATHIPDSADAAGRYEWTWAPADAMRFSVGAPGYECFRNQALTAREAPYTLVLRRRTVVHGTVTDAVTGVPIPEFTIVPCLVPRRFLLLHGAPELGRSRTGQGRGGEYTFTLSTDFWGTQAEGTRCGVQIEAPGYTPVRSSVLAWYGQPVQFDAKLTPRPKP